MKSLVHDSTDDAYERNQLLPLHLHMRTIEHPRAYNIIFLVYTHQILLRWGGPRCMIDSYHGKCQGPCRRLAEQILGYNLCNTRFFARGQTRNALTTVVKFPFVIARKKQTWKLNWKHCLMILKQAFSPPFRVAETLGNKRLTKIPITRKTDNY